MKEHKKEFGITNWCIENKTTVYIIIIMVTVMGLFTYQNLPKESFPEIVVPQMVITTIYPGTRDRKRCKKSYLQFCPGFFSRDCGI
jgi:hypothetical protein